ncbi:MAG: Flp pilus assembly complex ATPase component TadA [Phycisphaerales bacterium]|nr:Flp pilus assembly complex ATPase component TadA [Phycisphaerales bacterium]
MQTTQQLPANRMAYLEFHTPEGSCRYQVQGDRVTIGRHPDNMIVIRDERSSRFQCVVERRGSRFVLRDQGSRNGTKLNGDRITDADLQHGDVIRIGSTELTFIDPDGPARPPRPDDAVPVRLEDDPQVLPAEVEPLPLSPLGRDPGDDETPTTGILGELDDINDPLSAMHAPKRSHDHLPKYAQSIMAVIDAVPRGSVDLDDITIIDAGGAVRHKRRTKDGGGAEAIDVFRLLLLACFRARATDLHLEPKRTNTNARIRVDGFLLKLSDMPKSIGQRIRIAVKVLCQIDTAQQRIVQEGHFSVQLPDRHVDYRASFTPSVNGQNLVIRVLDSAAAPATLSQLGMVGYMHTRVKKISRQDSGLLMVCGPTGSGKTTTLYAILREIDREQRNVITIEDPIEFQIEGVTQLPVNDDRGNSFSGLLRSVLRQDPDVLLVGEIRDIETARTAMQASMTGHVVLTTVHARDTIGSIFRLIDLGVEPYLVANALNMVLAQRLIRRLCSACKKPVAVTPTQSMSMGRFIEGVSEIMSPVGCKKCLRTGFHGRRAIFELLQFNDELRDIILKEPTIQAMRRVIATGLFTTLQQSAYQLVARGRTSYSEAERVAGTIDG